MKILLFYLITVTLSLPNSAPYIHQLGRPLNIAHRGLCSILPQNTLQAFQAALYQGADFIQLDVVYTKQRQLLVMHDPFLTRITNIRNHTQFQTRYETRSYNGKPKLDWWTDKFTIQQLRTLGIKQDQAPGRIKVFDYKFTFPLLSQVIEMVVSFNTQHNGTRNPDKRLAGILIQAKDSQMYRDLYNIEIGQTILQLLKMYKIDTIEKAAKVCPIYLHSFDYGTVKYWAANTQLPRNYLVEGNTRLDLEDINKYATGIGFQDTFLWDYKENKPATLLAQARSYGLIVHIWTFKDDVLLFNAKNNIVTIHNIGNVYDCSKYFKIRWCDH